MPTVVKLSEVKKSKKAPWRAAQAKKQIAKKDKEDGLDEDDEDLANDTEKKLCVDGGEGLNNNMFGEEGHEQDPSPDSSDSGEPDLTDQPQFENIADENVQHCIREMLDSQKKYRERQTERTDRLFAVSRSNTERLTELEAASDAAALLWPPKGWTITDLRNYVLPEWESGRIGRQQGVLSLSNPYEVPLRFKLADVSCFHGVRTRFKNVSEELTVVQQNGSSIKMQLRQINNLKSELLAKQVALVGNDKDLTWFFRLSFPQPRHIVKGVPDDSDDWSIDILWSPAQEIYRTLLQCTYDHTSLEQKWKIDEKVVNDMGPAWSSEAVRTCIASVVRMYRFETVWYDGMDPPLSPRGKYRNKPQGKKGAGKNHKFVNRAQEGGTVDLTDSLPKAVEIPGVASQQLPASMTGGHFYPMAIGTGKGAGKGLGKGGEYGGKPYGGGKTHDGGKSYGFDGGKSYGGKPGRGGKQGGRFGAQKGKGGGKFGGGSFGGDGYDIMSQLAMLLGGGGSYGSSDGY